MALLSFPVAPANGDLYPIVPVVGQYQYRWSSADATWRLIGAATGVTAGTYGDATNVGQFRVNAVGQIEFAQNIPIPLASTTQAGLVALVDDTITIDSTKALTATQGYFLQTQIGDVTTLNPPFPNVVDAINAGVGVTGVTAGTYGSSTLIPQFTVNTQGRITSATNVAPFVATTSNLGVVRVGTNIDVAAGTISVATASTTTAGITQLVDNTTTNNPSRALTAAQGYLLQQQVNALLISNNITLAGTIDGATGLLTYVTAEAALIGFVVGGPLPTPSATNKEYFVIVSNPGTFTPTGGAATACNTGDWFLSTGVLWQILTVGPAIPVFQNYDDISGLFDGVLTSFPLTIGAVPFPPAPSTNITVFLGGVAQTPGLGNAYTVTGSTITFDTAPLTGTGFYATTIA